MDERVNLTRPTSPVNTGPVVTKRRFSGMSGLTEETIRGMAERGHLPTIKVGRHRMINVAAITRDALEAEFEL